MQTTTTEVNWKGANGHGSHEHHATWAEYGMSCECGLAKVTLTAEQREAMIQEMIAQDGGV